MNFQARLHNHAQTVEQALRHILTNPRDNSLSTISAPDQLGDAMRYSTLDQGKRFRPFLVLESASLFEVNESHSANVAAAIECVHCYSLIHDDLPAMDDDVLRRGKATTHIAFDEATAILAGDALLTLAFEILSSPGTHPDPEIRLELVQLLSRAAGWSGMVGGQMFDLIFEGRKADAETVRKIHTMKTGALIAHSVESGAVLGLANPNEREALNLFGKTIGAAFQISDDLLDVEGEASETGKSVGKDEAAGKSTLVSLLGTSASRDLLYELETNAIRSLEIFGDRASTLVESAKFITHRHR